MKEDEVKKTLLDYQKELEGILSRFKKTRDGIYIGDSDDSYLRKIVIKLKDFLDDVFGKQNDYSINVINYYDNGQANFLNMPCYRSVEQIRDVVSAVITRMQREPELLMKKREKQNRADLKEPAKVTLSWLFHHVTIGVWLYLVGFLIAAFTLGVKVGQIGWVQDLISKK